MVFSISCKRQSPRQSVRNAQKETFMKGTFGYDLDFLRQYHDDMLVLKDHSGDAQVIVCPAYQGRVMTSTAKGLEGYSFGWVNHELIGSGELKEHMNGFGGEDRIWLGPEGGQFSIYFKPGAEFVFDNWYVPDVIDTEPFDLLSANDSEAVFTKKVSLINYSGTKFDFTIDRKVRMLSHDQAAKLLSCEIVQGVDVVAFESENVLTNKGEHAWDKASGMLSVWILGMYIPSPAVTVIIPFKEGDKELLGNIVTDDYFGKVPADRLKIKDGIIYFKADGKYRSKIGLSPLRATPFAGSYDADNNVLTIVNYTLPKGETDYVNSLWKIQEKPFSGDAVNAYNDGPLEDGSQMGPFYEIESSSPAAKLNPTEKLTHYHRTFHFQGNKEGLNKIAQKVLGVELTNIEGVFNQ